MGYLAQLHHDNGKLAIRRLWSWFWWQSPSKLDSWEGFRPHLLGNSKRGQGVSAVTLATLCHIIMRLSGSRKPSLKEYKVYRFAGVLRRHTGRAG